MGLRKPKSNRLGVDYAGDGRGGRRRRHGVPTGRRGVRREERRLRRVRLRSRGSRDRAEAGERDVRGGRGRACRGDHRAAGPPRQGAARPGQKVLINGASGGVGTFAVQIAKALGAEVTAVCSTANVDIARSLGADHVVDYTQEDFTRSDRRYDLLLDVAGSRSWSECKRVLDAARRPSSSSEARRRIASSGRWVTWSGMRLGGNSEQPEGRVLHREAQQGGHGVVLRELLESREGDVGHRPALRVRARSATRFGTWAKGTPEEKIVLTM